jgi:hypothetical protein
LIDIILDTINKDPDLEGDHGWIDPRTIEKGPLGGFGLDLPGGWFDRHIGPIASDHAIPYFGSRMLREGLAEVL